MDFHKKGTLTPSLAGTSLASVTVAKPGFQGPEPFYFQEIAAGQQIACLWSVCFLRSGFPLIWGELTLICSKTKPVLCFPTFNQ